MQFLYSALAGEKELEIKDETFKHLKAMRVRQKDKINFSNLKDDFIYTYELMELRKKEILAFFLDKKENSHEKSGLSLALAMIEPRIIEKILPFLNEMNLDKLVLVYTDFSQRNFKLDLNRCEKILISSCEQCGRNKLMQIELFKDIYSLNAKYEDIILLDFEAKDYLDEKKIKDSLLFVGCEGGFSQKERDFFTKKLKIKSPNILRSQSAIIGLCAKILL